MRGWFPPTTAESPGEPEAGEDDDGPTPLPTALSPEAQVELAAAAERRNDWIGAAGRPDRTVSRGDYRRTADFRASATDPDTSLKPGRGGGLDLLYHDHDVVDGGKARIVLAPLVTPVEVTEILPPRDVLWRTCVRWKLWPRQVTGDTAYGITESIVAVADAGIRATVPLPDFNGRTVFFGKGEFSDDPDRDAYQCPRSERLPFRKHPYTERVRVSHAPRTTGEFLDLPLRKSAVARLPK